MTNRGVQVAQILWPAFLMAGLLEMVVFVVVDPRTLHFGFWEPDPTTAYSVAFMVFWTVAALAAAASHWLMAQSASAPAHRQIRHGALRRAKVRTRH